MSGSSDFEDTDCIRCERYGTAHVGDHVKHWDDVSRIRYSAEVLAAKAQELERLRRAHDDPQVPALMDGDWTDADA